MDNWIRNSKVVYIIALVLSVLLWLVVHMEGRQQTPTVVAETERSKEINGVSIDTVGLDETKYFLVSIDPSEVRLRVTGKPADLAKVTTQNAKVQLNLAEAVSGQQRIALEPVGFPAQVQVEIFPSFVTVIIEENLTREMPVTIEPIGQPEEGLVVGTPIVQPNRVFVTTPESDIDEIESIRGEIDVSGAVANVKKQIRLTAYNKDGMQIQADINPSVVEVEVPISLPSKTIPLQIRMSGLTAPGYSVASMELVPAEVIVFANQTVLDELEFFDGGVLDVSNLTASQSIPFTLPKPDNIEKVEPSTVEVKLQIVPAVRRVFEQVPLHLTGLKDHVEAVIVEPESGTLAVTLEGSAETLAEIKPEDIDLIVEVGNLSPGQHTVSVSYSLPSFVRVIEEQPAVVTVNIIEVSQNEEDEPAAEDSSGPPTTN